MNFDIIGKSVRRGDVVEKITGSARYVGDLRLPGMLFARSLRSTIAHANIVRIDASRARALPGVKAVLTHQDVPRVLHYGSPAPRNASLACDQYILDRKVRYWGETVAVVAAISDEIAEEALALIEVVYEPLPVMTTVEAALAPGAALIHDVGPGGNLVAPPVKRLCRAAQPGASVAHLRARRSGLRGRPFNEPAAARSVSRAVPLIPIRLQD